MIKEVNISNTRIANVSPSELRDIVKDFLKSDGKKKISKVNTEFLLRALKNNEFHKTLDSCGLTIADGRGVLWTAKYLSMPIMKAPIVKQVQAIWQMIYSGASLVFYPNYCKYPIKENISGVEAMYLMLEAAKETDSGVYFFGAEQNVLPVAIEKIQEKYPKLSITGYHDGYDYKDEEIIQDINQSEAKFLIVALGSPKQEYWLRDNMNKLSNVRVAVGEGGSLDFVAGESKRAPEWMQKLGLEWLWRLFMNKSKSHTGSRAKRAWHAVPVFIYEVVRYKIKGKE